ncbi:MAG TPA: ribosome maturation factor RimM [Acidimicrobiales bacterium]
MLEVGRVGKPHGLTGEVVVTLVSNRPERVVVGSTFLTDDGELRIEASRPFTDKWLMTFAGIDSREQAEALRGTVLRGRPLEDENAWWVHELIGAEVVDLVGAHLGNVAGVLANPASDLLELDGGALVPLRFVVKRGAGRVVVDVPAGLFDLPDR